MQLEQAAAILKYHSSENWPDHSNVVESEGRVAIVIRVGTEAEPVVVVVTVDVGIERPIVDIFQQPDRMMPLEGISDVGVLSKLGGTLVQVSNLVDQLIAVGGQDGLSA